MNATATPGSIAGMIADALEVHYTDGCCTPNAYCDEAQSLIAILADEDANEYGPGSAAVRPATDKVGHRPDAGSRAGNQYGTFAVKNATPAQLRYVKRLLTERDPAGVNERQATVLRMAASAVERDAISKRLASSALDILTRLPERTDLAPAATGASEKQAALIERLWADREHGLTDDIKTAALADRKVASSLIDALFNAPKRAVAPVAQLESGIYTANGQVYKVYWNQEKTRMLAKLLVLGADGEKASWDYQGMASRFVTADQRMTLEQAKQFGAIYGVCCNCGATLTDEVSIEQGIGPVCAKRFA